LGIAHQQFLDSYTDHRWPGTQSFLLIHRDGACIFLKNVPEKKIRLCGIHSFKPACCLDWEAGINKPECRKGLKDVWDLSVTPSGQISGEPEQLSAFEKAIQEEITNPQ
jgi:Fe-S-cluster containining protein